MERATANELPHQDSALLEENKDTPFIEPLGTDAAKSEVVFPVAHQLYLGDALQIMKTWPEGFFDACITDPPYNIARHRKGLKWAFSSHVTLEAAWDRFSPPHYEIFTQAWLSEVCRVTKKNGNIFIFGSYHNIYAIGAAAQRMDLRFVNSIIWAKPNAQPNITCRMFTESTEQILWLCNNTQRDASGWTFNYLHMKEMNGGKQMRNFWEIPVVSKKERLCGKHPSQKPLKLMERLVLAGTRPADCVLDCFAGSGSTLLACDRLDRQWIGIEKEEEYCQIAHARVKQARQEKQMGTPPHEIP